MLSKRCNKWARFELAAIGADGAQTVEGVTLHRYTLPRVDVSGTHPFARRFDAECWRAEQVLMAASALAASGFTPDIILAHCGWGETLPLRAAFPKAKLVLYAEFFYRGEGQDVHFDPEAPRLGVDGLAALQCKNASYPTRADRRPMWPSRRRGGSARHFPSNCRARFRSRTRGSTSSGFDRTPARALPLPSGRIVTKSDEVLTFASRNLEPLRGYHVFMRALPEILRARPEAQVVIAGGDGNSYSHAPPPGRSWKTHYLDTVVSKLDLSRVHFVGLLAPASYLSLLQVSSVHVYLTYPFVLSWSLLDAMATECEIVASDTAPVREVVEDRRNGVLVPFLDPSALAEAVSARLGRRGQASDYGRCGEDDHRRALRQADLRARRIAHNGAR